MWSVRQASHRNQVINRRIAEGREPSDDVLTERLAPYRSVSSDLQLLLIPVDGSALNEVIGRSPQSAQLVAWMANSRRHRGQ